MNGSLSCRVERPSKAKPEAIYDLLMDLERWPEFMPSDAESLTREMVVSGECA
jgi:ribosome-associated toxin RatA of RatAB toxin-antitoxin module